MTRGVVLFAHNNEQIDYVAQACFLAKRIKHFMDLPTTIVTDDKQRVLKYYNGANVFDNIIVSNPNIKNKKTYNDGSLSKKVLDFKNYNRSDVYDITPYDETLVMDTDYIISNNLLANCNHDLMLYKNSLDVSGWRDDSEFRLISETSIDFYWATVIFFRKTKENKMFFDLVKHIKENYAHYRLLYQITSTVFRNDYAFSIAAAIMKNVVDLPGKMVYTTARDILHKVADDELTMLVEKQDRVGEYTLLKSKGTNLHVMNKFSLNRMIQG